MFCCCWSFFLFFVVFQQNIFLFLYSPEKHTQGGALPTYSWKTHLQPTNCCRTSVKKWKLQKRKKKTSAKLKQLGKIPTEACRESLRPKYVGSQSEGEGHMTCVDHVVMSVNHLQMPIFQCQICWHFKIKQIFVFLFSFVLINLWKRQLFILFFYILYTNKRETKTTVK